MGHRSGPSWGASQHVRRLADAIPGGDYVLLTGRTTATEKKENSFACRGIPSSHKSEREDDGRKNANSVLRRSSCNKLRS